MVFVRGDHRVNDIKLANALGERLPARARRRAAGPRRLPGPERPTSPSLFDDAVVPRPVRIVRRQPPGSTTASSRSTATRGDVRTVEAGDTVNGHPIRIEPAIEIGNIFRLGTRYSEPLGATYLDENGKEQLDRHGLLRHRAGAHRRRGDRAVRRRARASRGRGRSRPGRSSSSPWASRARPSATRPRGSTTSSAAAGLDVLLDDRDAGPGEKFADAELLGVPAAPDGRQALARVRARRGPGPPRPRRPRGRRAARGRRRGRARAVGDPPVERPRLSFRRLSGLDRSGPPPPQTLPGAPLNLWTIPNAIGYRPPRAAAGLPRSSRCRSDTGTDAVARRPLRRRGLDATTSTASPRA